MRLETRRRLERERAELEARYEAANRHLGHWPRFEYGIEARFVGVHRTGMTREGAERWLAEWIEEGDEPDGDLFKIIRREVTPWEHPIAVRRPA